MGKKQNKKLANDKMAEAGSSTVINVPMEEFSSNPPLYSSKTELFPPLNIVEFPEQIGIIGTGDFGRGLATRAVAHGLSVTMGSRCPEKRLKQNRSDILHEVDLTTIERCIRSSDFIIVALHPENHDSLAPLASEFDGKVVIDVSNSLEGTDGSFAEKLSHMLKGAAVVKALNTLSAYALASETLGQQAVSVCSDHPVARRITMDFINRLGYLAVNCGTLAGAKKLEDRNRQLFKGFGYGTMTMCILFVGWSCYAGWRYYTLRPTYTNNEPPYDWYMMFSEVLSKVFGDVSVTMLALAYIPGPIAALKQLVWGTKFKRFHKSLDKFLAMRKALGLYALLMAVIHGIMFIFLMSGAHLGAWYTGKSVMIVANLTHPIELDLDPRLNWKGQICGLLGAVAMALMGVVGITSIGSVGASMNWREWQCIQSHLGTAVLVLSVLHVAIHAGPNWVKFKANHWPLRKPTQTAFLCMMLPIFTLILKLIVICPCVYIPVSRIRKGWERGEKYVVKSSKPERHPINEETSGNEVQIVRL